MEFKDRIKEFRRVKASDLLANPLNHRLHPEPQRKAIRKTLKEIGFAGALLCREVDGQLLLLDGHMRAAECGDKEVPVLILDVSEVEGNKILASYDAIGAMAKENEKALADIMATFSSMEDAFSLDNEDSIINEISKDEEQREKERKERNEKLKSGEELFGVQPGDIWRIRAGSYIYCGSFKDKLFHEMINNQSKKGRVPEAGHLAMMLNAPRNNRDEMSAYDIMSDMTYLDEGWTFTNNSIDMVKFVLDTSLARSIYTLNQHITSQIVVNHGVEKVENIRVGNAIGERIKNTKTIISTDEDILPLVDGAFLIAEPAAKLIAMLKKKAEESGKSPLFYIPSANTGALVRIASAGSYCKILAAEPDPMNCESILQSYFEKPCRNHKRRDLVDPPEKMDKWKISTES